MFIIPHGAPEGYEWFVALVVLVGLSISLFAISSGRILPSPPKYLKKARPLDSLPDPNPVRPGPGPEQRLRNIQRRFRVVSERHDLAEGRGRKGKRP
jgi:hypothetical protein